MKVTLYGLPGSHPVRSARLMLEYKGIEYKNVDIFPVMTRFVVPHVLRFPDNKVPAMKIDGEKVQGTMAITRKLDQVRPDPPLFPADPAKRAAVEEAERWGDGFQQMPRTIIWWAFKHAPAADQASFLRDAKLGLPAGLLARTGQPIVWAARKLQNSTDEQVEQLLSELPAALDKVDALIADGTINGEQLNAADFQIAPTVRLLLSMQDLRPAIESRPAGAFAKRVQPKPPGEISKVFPKHWLEPLRETAPA